MPTLDLSISPPAFVSFTWNGWPADAKDRLIAAVQALAGVRSVQTAGGPSAILVHFDPSVIDEASIILAVDQAADEALPGYNFAERN